MMKILRLRRSPDEDNTNYNIRTNLKILYIFKREEAAQLHYKVLREYHSWVWSWGHARFEDGTYILRDVMEAHQIDDWHYLQASMQQLDPTNTEKWKRRIGGVRAPWEKLIVEHYGEESVPMHTSTMETTARQIH